MSFFWCCNFGRQLNPVMTSFKLNAISRKEMIGDVGKLTLSFLFIF
jgi:hypothetical protein